MHRRAASRTGGAAASLQLAWAAVLAGTAQWWSGADAKVCTGTASSDDGFAFLCKFCYDYKIEGMTFQADITMPAGDIPYNLRVELYDDQKQSWPAVYKNTSESLTCKARSNWPRVIGKTYYSLSAGTTPNVFSTLEPMHEHLRPRTWFAVISSEDCSAFKDVPYTLTFINGPSGWSNQFGVDEQGLNSFFLVCLFIYLGLMAMQYKCESGYPGSQHLVRLLSCSIVTGAVSVSLYSIHYLVYTSNGQGVTLFKGMAEIANTCSELFLILLLLLFAQGWTIFNANVQYRKLLMGVLGALCAAKLALRLWAGMAVKASNIDGGFVLGHDAASTYTVWDSFPGTVIVIVDLAVFALCVLMSARTLNQHSLSLQRGSSLLVAGDSGRTSTAPRTFKLVAATGITWMVVRPALVLIFANALNPWRREKYMDFLMVAATLAVQLMLTVILWPTRGGRDLSITEGKTSLSASLLNQAVGTPNVDSIYAVDAL